MTARPAHFTQAGEDSYLPTKYAQSHWGPDHLNGPALVGLAARSLEAKFGLPEFMPARLTADLFKAARGVPTTTRVSLIRDGRRVRNSECEIVQDGVTVVRATMVQYRRSAAPRGEEWASANDFAWPRELGGVGMSYMGSDGVGWTKGIARPHRCIRLGAGDRRRQSRRADRLPRRPVPLPQSLAVVPRSAQPGFPHPIGRSADRPRHASRNSP